MRYVVAPYEADAQMQQLFNEGLVDCCLTTDADLIIYGMPLVLFCKSSTWIDGNCRYYEASKLARLASPQSPLVRLAKAHGAAPTFRIWAALVGCDYGTCNGIGKKGALAALEAASAKAATGTELALDDVLDAAAGPKARAKGHRKKKKTTDGRDAKICNWNTAASMVLACYKHQVVYDTKMKESTHLSPHESPPLCCGALLGGTTIIPMHGDDNGSNDDNSGGGGVVATEVATAEAAAFGHLVTGAPLALPPVTAYHRSGDTEAVLLTDDLVLEVPPLTVLLSEYGTDEEKAELGGPSPTTNLRLTAVFRTAVMAANGKALPRPSATALRAFLASRNVMGVSSDKWSTLATKTADLLELEQTQIRDAEAGGRTAWIVIRDASGRSLHQINAGVAPSGDANAGVESGRGGGGGITIADPSKWVTEVATLSVLVPAMRDGTIETFFAGLGAEVEGSNPRAISRGYAHVASKHRLKYAAYHPSPDPSDTHVVALRAVIPASRKNQAYRVTALVRWSDVYGERVFTEVVDAECRPEKDDETNGAWCRNALSRRCTHIAGLLLAFAHLPRSSRVGSSSVTEGLQMWHVPTSGTRYDPIADVALLPVVKPDRRRPVESRCFTVGMLDTAGRRALSTVPASKKAALGRGESGREEARRKLHAALRRDYAEAAGAGDHELFCEPCP